MSISHWVDLNLLTDILEVDVDHITNYSLLFSIMKDSSYRNLLGVS
jgi:hypothetical protein